MADRRIPAQNGSNVQAGQKQLHHRAMLNAAARAGTYDPRLELETAAA